MNEMRVKYLLEALKMATQLEDNNFRSALRREIAIELRLTPPSTDAGVAKETGKRLEVIEEHFDRVCGEKENLKEAIRLISETF